MALQMKVGSKIYRLISVISLVLTVTSCVKLERDTMPTEHMEFFPICNRHTYTLTKGTTITSSNIETFVLTGYTGSLQSMGFYSKMERYNLIGNDFVVEGGSSVKDNPEWKVNQLSKFWAWSGEGCTTVKFANQGCTRLQLSVNEAGKSVDELSDLIIAYAKKTYDGEDNHLYLHFYHALAKVQFIKNPTTTVERIPLTDVFSVSTSTVNVPKGDAPTFNWSSMSNRQNFILTNPTWTRTVINDVEYDLCEQHWFLIPQEYDGTQWKAGYYYTYRIVSDVLATKSSNMTTLELVDCGEY